MQVTDSATTIQSWLQEGNYALGPGQFTVSIPGAGSTWPGYNFLDEPTRLGFRLPDTDTANAFVQAINRWDELIAPQFTEVADDAGSRGELRVAYTDLALGDAALTYQDVPQASGTNIGDVWINTLNLLPDWDPGSDDFATLLHEVGFALGLMDAEDSVGLPGAFDSDTYTVMSYENRIDTVVNFVLDGGNLLANVVNGVIFAETPMVLDIAAVQEIYGADPNTRSGDTTYTFTEWNLSLQSIYDAGGIDTLDMSGFSLPSIIDLNPGAYSSVGFANKQVQIDYWSDLFPAFTLLIETTLNGVGDLFEFEDNVGIALSTIIENAIGGSGDDIFTGNAVANELQGGAGNDELYGAGDDDTLIGGAGDDILDGQGGSDTASGGTGDDQFFVNKAGDTVVELADEGFDTVWSKIDYTLPDNTEKLILQLDARAGTGNALANEILGSSGDDTILGMDGKDFLNGRDGDDVIDGGRDKDRLYGEIGRDVLTGGNARDVYIFRDVAESPGVLAEADVITEFQIDKGERILLRAIDANDLLPGNQAFNFIGTDAFGNNAGELRYEVIGSDSFVTGDIDGDAVADFGVYLDDVTVLTAASFAL